MECDPPYPRIGTVNERDTVNGSFELKRIIRNAPEYCFPARLTPYQREIQTKIVPVQSSGALYLSYHPYPQTFKLLRPKPANPRVPEAQTAVMSEPFHQFAVFGALQHSNMGCE